jgi:AMP nucleosidase
MESATIVAMDSASALPYGTLLCVSDKPLHGVVKLPGMADAFYRQRVDQHLELGLRAIDLLRAQPPEQLHSRTLRSFAEVPLR